MTDLPTESGSLSETGHVDAKAGESAMSGYVCVRDAEGRPLMPAAAAYSRTLLAAGKAVLLPHPALSVIDLTHAVPHPVLHPLLLGVAVHPMTATLILVSGHRGGTVLARCIVDAPREASPTAAAPSPMSPPPQRQNHAIAATVATLQRFFPISHIALLEPVPSTSDTRHQRDTLATMQELTGCSVSSKPG